MALTDKQYWLLAAAADAFRTCPANNSSMGEITAGIADGHVGTTKDGFAYRAAEALLADDRLNRLVLTDRMTFGAAEAYAFDNEHEDKLFIFTYRTANEAEALASLYGAESRLLAEAGAFLRRNRGAGSCRVTGRGIGGALAAYAALTAESAELPGDDVAEQTLTAEALEAAESAMAARVDAPAQAMTAASAEEVALEAAAHSAAAATVTAASDVVQGVIFDAPGIANKLTDEQRANDRLIHYVSPDSWLSAIGTHGGEVRFAAALPADDGGEAQSPIAQSSSEAPYRFGPDGRILTGEPSALYVLLSRLNRLTEAATPEAELVLRAFAEAAGMEQEAEEQPGFTLLMMMERLTMVSATLGLENVKQQFERIVYHAVHVWKEEAGALFRSLPPEELHGRLEAASASCANELATATEQVYACVEAVLSALILAHGDEAIFVDHLQLSLAHFAEWLEARMDRLEEEMGAQLEAYVSIPAIDDLSVPEFDLHLELGE